MAKILILGGGGMIGQKLISKLLNEGLAPYRELDIVAFDLGFAPDALAGVQNIRGSLTDEAALRQLCAQRPDVVFHLAAYNHVGDSFKVGLGYNFTEFSDDLTDLDYEYAGWYINLLGKY